MLDVAAKLYTSVSLRNEDLKKPYQGIVIRLPSLGYRISSNNSSARLFLFSHKKGASIRRKAIISNIAHWKSCLKHQNILFIFSLNKKNNHIK